MRSTSPLRAGALLGVCFFLILTATAQTTASEIETHTRGLQKLDGFFPLYWDAKAGKLLLEIPAFEHDFLYLDQLPYGIGSNDLALDRGQLGNGRVVHFMRSGTRSC